MNRKPSTARRTNRDLVLYAAQRGLSLIEICAALMVASILAGVGVPRLSSLIEGQRVEGLAQQMASHIRFARSQSILRGEAVRLSFASTTEGTCYLIHTGKADQCSCNASGEGTCRGGAAEVIMSQSALAPGIRIISNVPSLAFDPRIGTVAPAGTISVSGSQGRTVHHVVSPLGRIRSCTLSTGQRSSATC